MNAARLELADVIFRLGSVRDFLTHAIDACKDEPPRSEVRQ